MHDALAYTLKTSLKGPCSDGILIEIYVLNYTGWSEWLCLWLNTKSTKVSNDVVDGDHLKFDHVCYINKHTMGTQ